MTFRLMILCWLPVSLAMWGGAIAIAFFASRFAEPRHCTEGGTCPEPAHEIRPEVQP